MSRVRDSAALRWWSKPGDAYERHEWVVDPLHRWTNLHATAAQAVAGNQVNEDEIVLYEVDDEQAISGADEFMVTTDVSFPLEIPEQSSLADQLQKLQQLREQEIISSEEFAIAKAKLLK
jgi:hypothetical protein